MLNLQEKPISPHSNNLNSMKEDCSPLGKIRSRLTKFEKDINDLEFQQDSLQILLSIKDSVPSLLKLQQPVIDLHKKITNSLLKCEETNKKLNDLKENLKNFHLNLSKEINEENNVRNEKNKENISECEKMEIKLQEIDKSLSEKLMKTKQEILNEVSKLLIESEKYMDDLKKEIMLNLFEKDRNFNKNIDEIKSQFDTIKSKINLSKPKISEDNPENEKIEKLIVEEVLLKYRTLLEQELNQFLNKPIEPREWLLPKTEKSEKMKNCEEIMIEYEKVKENMEKIIENMKEKIEEIIEKYLEEYENANKISNNSYENLLGIQKEMEKIKRKFSENNEEFKKKIKENTEISEIDHENLMNKIMLDESNFERDFIQIQVKLETSLRRIQMDGKNY